MNTILIFLLFNFCFSSSFIKVHNNLSNHRTLENLLDQKCRNVTSLKVCLRRLPSGVGKFLSERDNQALKKLFLVKGLFPQLQIQSPYSPLFKVITRAGEFFDLSIEEILRLNFSGKMNFQTCLQLLNSNSSKIFQQQYSEYLNTLGLYSIIFPQVELDFEHPGNILNQANVTIMNEIFQKSLSKQIFIRIPSMELDFYIDDLQNHLEWISKEIFYEEPSLTRDLIKKKLGKIFQPDSIPFDENCDSYEECLKDYLLPHNYYKKCALEGMNDFDSCILETFKITFPISSYLEERIDFYIEYLTE